MLNLIFSTAEWTGFAGHFSSYSLSLLTAALGAGAMFQAVRMRQQPAKQKSTPMLFKWQNRKESGMSVFYADLDDPKERAAFRAMAQRKR